MHVKKPVWCKSVKYVHNLMRSLLFTENGSLIKNNLPSIFVSVKEKIETNMLEPGTLALAPKSLAHPIPRNARDTAREAIPSDVYRPCVDDVVRLRPIFYFPTVWYCTV